MIQEEAQHGRTDATPDQAGSEALCTHVHGVARLLSWYWDMTGDKVLWHGDAGDLLGIEATGYRETLARFLAKIHPDDREATGEALDRCQRGELSECEREIRVVRAPGDLRWIQVAIRSQPGDDGRPAAILGVLRDVTEWHSARIEIEKREQQYRQLFDAALDAIAVASPDGLLVDVNPAACRLAMLPREALIGRDYVELFLLDDPARSHARLRAILDGGAFVGEREIRRPDGSRVAVEMKAWRLPDGNVQTIVRDVSERRRHREMLLNIERGLSSRIGSDFFDSLAGHLAHALEVDVVIIGRVSPAGVKTLAAFADGAPMPGFVYVIKGTPCEEALLHRGSVLIADDAARKFPGSPTLVALGARSYAGSTLLDSAGEAIGILAVASRKPFEDPEFVAAVVELFAARAASELIRLAAEERVRDANAQLEERVRSRTRELEEANRELESFTYTISHDLRAPLRAIAGYSGIMREDFAPKLDDVARRHLERISANVERMSELIDDLLAFARTARDPIARVNVDMHALVAGMVESLRHAMPADAQLVIADLPSAHGDPALLRQVWQNLLSNAFKFSRDSHPARIEVHGLPLESGAVEYQVRDNGIGFDPQYASRLFGVFQRLHADASFEGTGVGLAIVQRIVTRHGGTVRAQGQPGAGATFSFTLPIGR